MTLILHRRGSVLSFENGRCLIATKLIKLLETWGLKCKTFYHCNQSRVVISQSVYHCQPLPTQSNFRAVSHKGFYSGQAPSMPINIQTSLEVTYSINYSSLLQKGINYGWVKLYSIVQHLIFFVSYNGPLSLSVCYWHAFPAQSYICR